MLHLFLNPIKNKNLKFKILLMAVGLSFTTLGHAQFSSITSTASAGISKINVGETLNTQIWHVDDESGEIYPSSDTLAAYGTFLNIIGDDDTYTPDYIPAGFTGIPFTPKSQTSTPTSIKTIVNAGETGLQITQTDSLVFGNQFYKTEIEVENSTVEPVQIRLYRAMDCYLENSDSGGGSYSGGLVACTGSDGRIEAIEPTTPDSKYRVGFFDDIWSTISNRQPFDNTIQSGEYDNGAGISWDVTVPANGSVILAHNTWFAPKGVDPTPPTPQAITPVPTLSEWGMVFMIVLMMGLGFYQARRFSLMKS